MPVHRAHAFQMGCKKIVEALSKIMDLFAGIGGMVKEMIDEAAKSFYAAMHEFCHWLMGGFFFGRRKEKSTMLSLDGYLSLLCSLRTFSKD